MADLLTGALTNEASRLEAFHVLSFEEVQGILSKEQVEELAECTDTSCLSEVAGAVGAQQIVRGNLGTMGKNYLLTLTRMSPSDGKVLGQSTQTLKGKDPAEVLDRLPLVTSDLFGFKPPPGAMSVAVRAQAKMLAAEMEENRPPSIGKGLLSWGGKGVIAASIALMAANILGGLGMSCFAFVYTIGSLFISGRPRENSMPIMTIWQAVVFDSVYGVNAVMIPVILGVGALGAMFLILGWVVA
jgi:hypothetical protein